MIVWQVCRVFETVVLVEFVVKRSDCGKRAFYSRVSFQRSSYERDLSVASVQDIFECHFRGVHIEEV